jgi:hypothetical protein
MFLALNCMTDTIAPAGTPMGANAVSASDPGRSSSCEPEIVTLSLFGANTSTTLSRHKTESSAPFSATKHQPAIKAQSLSAKLTAIADHVWPHPRHYTKVNPAAVRSANPGYCFLAAGWRRCGYTKGGLLILERIATTL